VGIDQSLHGERVKKQNSTQATVAPLVNGS